MNANVCINTIAQLYNKPTPYYIIYHYYYIVILLIIITANLLLADKIMHIISNICANA